MIGLIFSSFLSHNYSGFGTKIQKQSNNKNRKIKQKKRKKKKRIFLNRKNGRIGKTRSAACSGDDGFRFICVCQTGGHGSSGGEEGSCLESVASPTHAHSRRVHETNPGAFLSTLDIGTLWLCRSDTFTSYTLLILHELCRSFVIQGRLRAQCQQLSIDATECRCYMQWITRSVVRWDKYGTSRRFVLFLQTASLLSSI